MLLDTSGLMCLFDQRDIRHANATKYYDSAPLRLSHNYVLAEFVGLAIARRSPRGEALSFIGASASVRRLRLFGWTTACMIAPWLS